MLPRDDALGKGGVAGLVRSGPVRGAPAMRSAGVPEVEVLAPVRSEQRLYEMALERVYAIDPADQTPEMAALLGMVCGRLRELASIGEYEGQKAPRNATAAHNALKTLIMLTFGPQVQRSQKAVVTESRGEITVTHIQAPRGEAN